MEALFDLIWFGCPKICLERSKHWALSNQLKRALAKIPFRPLLLSYGNATINSQQTFGIIFMWETTNHESNLIKSVEQHKRSHATQLKFKCKTEQIISKQTATQTAVRSSLLFMLIKNFRGVSVVASKDVYLSMEMMHWVQRFKSSCFVTSKCHADTVTLGPWHKRSREFSFNTQKNWLD